MTLHRGAADARGARHRVGRADALGVGFQRQAMNEIAVLGSRGQLGAAVVHECSPHHDVAAFDHAALDITDAVTVAAAMARVAPDAIINCAAYNAVDAAEDHPVEALQANAIAVRTLARAAAAHGATLVHYSSDFVFDGDDDAVRRRGPAQSAERLCRVEDARRMVRGRRPAGYVLRVESLFGRAPDSSPKGSVAAIVEGSAGRDVPRVRGPHRVADLRRRCGRRDARDDRARVAAGLYHCVNTGHCTWLEFAERRRACWVCRPGSCRLPCRRRRFERSARRTVRCRTPSSRRPASPCPPGRMRWGVTWTAPSRVSRFRAVAQCQNFTFASFTVLLSILNAGLDQRPPPRSR